MAYDAFISYSHVADARVAPAVRTGLRNFAKPWNKGAMLAVFLDNEFLSAGNLLSTAIENALQDARYLVLCASLEAAKPGGWVEREVAWWIDHKEIETLLIVVTDGPLRWSEECGDFVWLEATPLPPVLRGKFHKEPVYVDLTWARNIEQLDLKQPRFSEAIRKLAATLHGKTPDELDGDDLRERRRTERLKRRVMTTLAVLSVLVVLFAIYALDRRNVAIENETRALAGRLSAESRYEIDKRIDLSLLLAAAAIELEPLGSASGAVMLASRAHPQLDVFLGRLDSSVRHIAMGRDERLAAVTDDNTVIVWHGQHRSMLWSRAADESEPPIHSLAFSRDGKRLAAGAEDGSIMLWDIGSNKRFSKIEGRGTAITCLAFSSDGKQLATRSRDGSVTLWDIANQRPLPERNPSTQSDFLAVSFTNDGRLLAVNATKDRLEIWDLTNRRRLDVMRTDVARTPLHIAFNDEGTALAFAIAQDTIVLRDLVRRKETRITLTARQGGIASLAVSADLARIATGGGDGSVILWRVEKPSVLGEWFAETKEAINHLAFSLDGKQLATVTGDDKLTLWDVGSRRQIREIVVSDRRGDTKGKVYGISFGPDKKLRAAVEVGEMITLLDTGSNEPPITAGVKHDGGTSSAAITTDGKLLAVGGRDGNIILWDTVHGKPYGKPLAGREQPPIRREYGDPAEEQTIITSLAFSSDGKRLFSASGKEVSGERKVEITWWDLTRPEPRKEQTIDYQATIDAAAFSPNGTMIATVGGAAGTVVLWDVPSSKQLEQPWAGHLSGALSVAFSPDIKRLAIGTGKGIFLGDVDPHAWQKQACATANRNLTCAEWRESFGTRPYKKICTDLPDSPEIGTCAGKP